MPINFNPVEAFNNAVQAAGDAAEAAQDAAETVIDTVGGTVNGVIDGAVDAGAEAADKAKDIAGRAMTAGREIVSDPIDFTRGLAEAVQKGGQQFIGNVKKHVADGAIEWVSDTMKDAGIESPRDFSLKSMVQTALHILGITKERMEAKAERLLGEKIVETARNAADKVVDLFNGGPKAAFEEARETMKQALGIVHETMQRQGEAVKKLVA